MDCYQATGVTQVTEWNWWCIGQHCKTIVGSVVVNTTENLNSTIQFKIPIQAQIGSDRAWAKPRFVMVKKLHYWL